LFNFSKNIFYEFKIKDNSYIISKRIYTDPDLKYDGVICIFSDITPIKEAHESVLETKKREITSYTMRLFNLSKMKDTLSYKLKNLLKLPEKEKNDRIIEILSNLALDSEQVSIEFETHFSTVFEDFYVNLGRLYPDLTTNERRLCAFLKLDLSTKEIASITFQNPKSIDMARYRLRKKMNLSQGDNVSDMLKLI
jgi:hypothetical protein